MSRAPNPEEEAHVIGRYALFAPIASGGMATVHLGRSLGDDPPRTVAIKRLHMQFASDPEFVTMFLDEARLAARIQHPNVVRTLDVVAIDGEVFLVMDYVPGESLARLTRGQRRPPCNIMSAILSNTLHGLHAAHEARDENGQPLHVVHRDISPQNVLVGTDGLARILDFGVAKGSGRMQQTREGEIKGKLSYMPPEQLREGTVSPQTDIYAAGVVLWEILTGRRLYGGDNEGAIIVQILEGAPKRPLDTMSPKDRKALSALELLEFQNLERVIMRALAPSQADRYQTAREMALDLELALPPARPEAVAAWVQATAGDVLASRAETVAKIESDELPRRPMDSEPPTLAKATSALLPIIVADLADAGARDFLIEIANARATVLVPLLAAPADGGEHILEVHVPDEPEATLFLAIPAGPPEPEGFPLTLRGFGQAAPPAKKTTESPTGQIVARTFTSQTLSDAHTRDLARGGANAAQRMAPEQDLIGRSLAGGKLVIETRLGAGGGGAVYLARHRDLRKEVAVKVLHDRAQRDLEFCARFHAEALAASKMDHPNLMRVIDFGQEPDGLLYLSMDYLEGSSLRDLLDRQGKLPLESAVALMLQVCSGLAHAHVRGIVHRDVKPGNIMLVAGLDDDDRPVDVVKVCDFGIALQRTMEQSEEHAGVAGTPQYMSPEQCRGGELDGRSDIYSCGVMLYEMVTGELPFQGRDDMDFVRLHLLAAPTPPSEHAPDIDPLLEQVILRTLAKTPEGRYTSMRELRTALKELLAPAFVPGVPGAPVPAGLTGASDAPPPMPGADDSWLEHGRTAIDSFFTSLASTVEQFSYHDGEELATEIARAPAQQMNQIAALRAGPGFAAETEKLELAVKVLAKRGDAVALGHVVRVMTAVHEESARTGSGTASPTSAGARAMSVLRTIADALTLAPLAEKILTAREEPTEADLSLLAWAEVAGAHALFNARAKLDAAPARARFVSAMRFLGAAVAPVVRGGLEQLMPAAEAPVGDPALVADLLRALPNTQDAAIGAVISRYVRVANPELATAALGALVNVWGERAKPVLLASLQSMDEAVRAAALRGLCALGGVDEFVARKIEGVVDGSIPAADELRIAAADALANATTSARGLAARILMNALTRPESAMMTALRGARSSPQVVLSLARAALTLVPADARAVVEARAQKSAEPLRAQLLALL